MHFPVLGLVLSALAAVAAATAAGGPVVVGYYPSWKRSRMDGVDFSQYTHINVAFGIPRRDGSFTFEDDWALPQIVGQVRAGGAKVLMSVGGWTGSNYFSEILKDGAARERLLSSMATYVRDNKLDGIDIDWEYPGRLGNTCNAVDPQNDAPNFLAFLKDLRARFDSDFGAGQRLITLAVRVQPFDQNGAPMGDVSEFAAAVDYANIMAYDINGPWNADTGPNAPLNFDAGKGTPLSLVSAVDAWTKAGWPARQLVAGVGFYGRATTAQQDMTRDSTNQYQPQLHDVPLGDSEDAPWYDACARTTSTSGTWQWKHLRDQGVLTAPDTAAAPWIRMWDDTSKTPWLFNRETKTFLSYDDPDSIRIKSAYAASRGLAGVMIWSANMDYNGELVRAARSFGNATAPAASSPGTSAAATSSAETRTSGATGAHSASTTESRPASASATEPAHTPSGGPTAGGACDSHNTYQCVDPSGRNAAYLVCVNGRLIAASCARGTVCLSLQSTIVCGWPALRGLVLGLDSLLGAV